MPVHQPRLQWSLWVRDVVPVAVHRRPWGSPSHVGIPSPLKRGEHRWETAWHGSVGQAGGLCNRFWSWGLSNGMCHWRIYKVSFMFLNGKLGGGEIRISAHTGVPLQWPKLPLSTHFPSGINLHCLAANLAVAFARMSWWAEFAWLVQIPSVCLVQMSAVF